MSRERSISFVFPERVFRTFSGYACAVLMFDVYTCRKKMAGLSESDVEKAHKAIAYLSSISVAASTTPTSSTNVGNLSSSETGKKSTPVMEAADKVLDALRRMRAGMTADRRVEKRKRIKNEVSMLFNKKPKVEKKRVVWRHKFVCLAQGTKIASQQRTQRRRSCIRQVCGRRRLNLNPSTYLRVNFEKSCSNVFPG